MVSGFLHVAVDLGLGTEGIEEVKRVIADLKIPGVQISVTSSSPIKVDLEAESRDLLREAASKVEQIKGVARVLPYRVKRAAASE